MSTWTVSKLMILKDGERFFVGRVHSRGNERKNMRLSELVETFDEVKLLLMIELIIDAKSI